MSRRNRDEIEEEMEQIRIDRLNVEAGNKYVLFCFVLIPALVFLMVGIPIVLEDEVLFSYTKNNLEYYILVPIVGYLIIFPVNMVPIGMGVILIVLNILPNIKERKLERKIRKRKVPRKIPTCHVCGASTNARKCPYCGVRINR